MRPTPRRSPHKMVNIDFPTAASIPAVSIMNPEPNGPVLPGVAAAAAANPNPQQQCRQRHAHNAAAPQSATSPPQSAGPAGGRADLAGADAGVSRATAAVCRRRAGAGTGASDCAARSS